MRCISKYRTTYQKRVRIIVLKRICVRLTYMGWLIFSLVVAVEYRLFHILSHFYPYITFLIRADFVRIYSVVFL